MTVHSQARNINTAAIGQAEELSHEGIMREKEGHGDYSTGKGGRLEVEKA